MRSCLRSPESFSAPRVSASSPSSEGDLRFNSAMFTDEVGNGSMPRALCASRRGLDADAGIDAECRARFSARTAGKHHRPQTRMPPTAAGATGEREKGGGRSGESHAKLSAPSEGVKGAVQANQKGCQSEMDITKGSSLDVGHDER